MEIDASQVGAIAGLVAVAVTLSRIVEQLVSRRIFGDRRDEPGGHEQRIVNLETEVWRLRDGFSRVYDKIEEANGRLARIEGKLE